MDVVNQQEHERELAIELLDDIELSSTTVSQQVLKSTRLARLVGDNETSEWLQFEMSGVPGSERGRAHMWTTSRWTDEPNDKGWWGPMRQLPLKRLAVIGLLMLTSCAAGDSELGTSEPTGWLHGTGTYETDDFTREIEGFLVEDGRYYMLVTAEGTPDEETIWNGEVRVFRIVYEGEVWGVERTTYPGHFAITGDEFDQPLTNLTLESGGVVVMQWVPTEPRESLFDD